MRTLILFSLSIGLGAILTLMAWAPTRQCAGHDATVEKCAPVGVVAWGMVFAEPETATVVRPEGCSHDTMAVRCCKAGRATRMPARMIRAALTSAGAVVIGDARDKDERVI